MTLLSATAQCSAVAFTDKVVETLFSRSSTEFNDNLVADLGIFLRILRHFSDSPARGESLGARILRALDDEEFFVIEGSPGCRGRRESDSQVTCHTLHNSSVGICGYTL